MRQIKFRAWDNIIKRMEHSRDSQMWVIHREPLEHIEIMQFTGLLDKNGKEIYEGDIVKHENGKNYEVKFGYFTESVNANEYSNNCYGWYLDDENLEDFNQIYNPDYVEIIGNIYENPELLT